MAIFLLNLAIYFAVNYFVQPDLSWEIILYGGLACCIVMSVIEHQTINFIKKRRAKKREKIKEEEKGPEIDKPEIPKISEEEIAGAPQLYYVAKWVISAQMSSVAMLERKFDISHAQAENYMEQLEHIGIVGPRKGDELRKILFYWIPNQDLLRLVKSELGMGVKEDLLQDRTDYEAKTKIKNKTKPRQNQSDILSLDLYQLKSLIGLDNVKDEIEHLTNFIKMQQVRKGRGLKTTSVSYHCVFTGNPGTGKTTVARIVAQIYQELGILSKGQLIETDRSGLVAEYVGQTAVKTNKIIDSALDGVLFIDEAYSLIAGGGNDYGKEAIATLLKRMEDDRDRLIVILAGYKDEMKTFIDSNPGLQSRFNRYIDFPDYSAEELMQIFCFNVKKSDYILTDEAKQKLQNLLIEVVKNKDKNFGNARFVRNIFEKTLEHQANRLAEIKNPTDEELKNIIAQDIEF